MRCHHPRPFHVRVLSASALLVAPALCVLFSGCAGANESAGPLAQDELPLRFQADGTFTIVHFTDTQDDQEMDPRTTRLMEAVLEDVAPDLVVFTGDNIRSGPQTPDDVRRAMDAVAAPVEGLGVPWLVTFGNHDEDHAPETGMMKADQLAYYMTFPHNRNRPGPEGVNGTGNMVLPVLGSASDEPVLAIWALDSGRYSPDSIGGQSVEADGLRTYDWIRPSQIQWYVRSSEELEASRGRKVPGLMFFHIPLPEFAFMWKNQENHGVVGEKNEDVAAGSFNSGLFAAVQDRGDIMGIFVGHDHINDYVGDYFGVRLGYSANAGFGTYGLDGDEPDRMRGARVLVIREDDPRAFETRMVFARDYGIQ